MTDWIWIHYTRARPHWYELSDADRAAKRAAWADVARETEAAGGISHGRYSVRGQSDFAIVETWGFPSADAAFDHWSRLTRAGYAEWFVSTNTIGLRCKDPA
ncbi:hypothetical protein [Acidisoma cladoniae]|jgi:hypothetical protein|uniref:hypothetical protein n=1 Tax=Acidisoma cladoniae TaxID=3040935 RepID=UPI0025508565|nr:hypothetical protein [Acidisoma sp. PAMC 29798]